MREKAQDRGGEKRRLENSTKSSMYRTRLTAACHLMVYATYNVAHGKENIEVSQLELILRRDLFNLRYLAVQSEHSDQSCERQLHTFSASK